MLVLSHLVMLPVGSNLSQCKRTLQPWTMQTKHCQSLEPRWAVMVLNLQGMALSLSSSRSTWRAGPAAGL